MKKSPILYSLIISVIIIGSINYIAFFIFDLIPPFPTDKPLLYFLCQIIGAFLLLLLSFEQVKSVFKCRAKGFFQGLLLGWPFIIASMITLIGAFLATKDAVFVPPRVHAVILFIIMTLFVGFIEEVLFRGVVLRSILNKYGGSKHGMIISVMISSFVFGLAHIVTLMIHPQLVMYTITQVIYCTFAGVLFSVVYLRCRNIFSLIILHSLVDISSLLPIIFYPSNKLVLTADTGIAELITYVVLHIPFLIIAAIYAKRLLANHSTETYLS